MTSGYYMPTANVTATTASFDNAYDNAKGSLDTVACSGTNALTIATKGARTFGALPSFPRIGGAPAVAGFNSPNCGSCWALTFENETINVLAIDVAASSFNIAQAALDELTGGQAVQLGRVNVTAVEVAPSACGL
ncbi:hypothetical protein M422DRAFT_61683 [Sphaerobolus stellatus SS14]|uniref:Cerato-platanin n=1 Tax=Sphaerobolus stellatus (strain SS14) TaxID=990650 RepID=A0A0C9UPW0_SPHS4|nr:hypothetical protein M422DRAFT_61683 [Sphaerobolus stellatus SS14]